MTGSIVILPAPGILALALWRACCRAWQTGGRDYEQQIEKSYLEKIQSGYFDFIRQQQNTRILIIDTNNIDFVNNPKDYKTIVDVISQKYDIGINRVVL